jgi:hypothetical protein
VATSNFMRHGLLIVDTSTGTVVCRLRAFGADTAVVREDHVDVYAPKEGKRLRLDRESFERIGTDGAPVGTRVVVEPGRVWMLTGDKAAIHHHIDTARAWEVSATQVVALDEDDLSVVAAAPAPAGAKYRLGVDRDRRLVAAMTDGIALLDAQTLAVAGRLVIDGFQMTDPTFCAGPQAIAICNGDPREHSLAVVRWS